MGLALDLNQGISFAVKRTIYKEIGNAIDAINNSTTEPVAHFHAARKDLKRVRSVLRLVRATLGKDVFKHENRRYRDIARIFSNARDATVLESTFNELMQLYPNAITATAISKVKHQLRQNSHHTTQAVLNNHEQLRTALRDLERARLMVSTLPLITNGWKAVGPGLRSTYKQARKAFFEFRDRPDAKNSHEWRKTSKYLRHEIELIQGCWQPTMKEYGKQVKQLTDCLGRDHDLAMLRLILENGGSAYATANVRNRVFQLIHKQQADLRIVAESLGERVFSEPSRAFTKRIRAYWKAWQRLPQLDFEADLDTLIVAPEDAKTTVPRVQLAVNA